MHMKLNLTEARLRTPACQTMPLLMPFKRAGGMCAFMASALLALLFAAAPALSSANEGPSRLLDGFDNVKVWRVSSSDDVDATLGADHGAIRLDFDFNGVSGFASLHRELPLSFSGNYALSLRVRGESPVNTLQVKLIDASGDNVWWINRPDFSFNGRWQTVRAERRQIEFAWGPTKERTLSKTAALEITLAAGKGGRGRIWLDDLRFEQLPPPRTTWPVPVVRASSELPQAAAAKALDGIAATSWRSDPTKGPRQNLEIDFGAPRPFGGLLLHWLPGREAARYAVQFSDDGFNWRTVLRVTDGNGGEDPLLLTESCTRYVRLALEDGPAQAYDLSEVEVKDLAWGASPNRFFEALAKTRRRGLYPRGFSGEQSYWTVVGVDGGGADSALISEDGAVELGKGGFSIEPFLMADGRLLTWADVSVAHALKDGCLPIPSVIWKTPDLTLSIEAFAAGDRVNSHLLTSYTVQNRTGAARDVTLVLASRPFQVNPPTQSLNTPSGVSPIHKLAWSGSALEVNGRPRVFPLQKPDAFVAGSFFAGDVVARLAAGEPPCTSYAVDGFGYGSGAMLFHLALPAYGRSSVNFLAPLSGALPALDGAQHNPEAWTAQERDAVVAQWRAKLNQIGLRLPESAQAIADTLRTSLAYILISRDGPALQPGTRSYARTWIRDGAMISEALLRMGRTEVVHDFIGWYAQHQFKSGKTPCCVDARGSDPVPENDSPGEFIFTVAELYRFTHDRAALKRLWPHVMRTVDYMEHLRGAEGAPADRASQRRAYYGLMPASISHEGYAAKPVHSYWDDFWALKGYDDAVDLARALGEPGEAERMAAARDRFRSDLLASIRTTVKQHDIDYLPGSAELGDFDAASTAIAFSPCGEQDWIPQGLLDNTFARYWREFTARREGRTDWDEYTPYELRTLAAFIRLGRRDRVQALLGFFLADRRPAPWNGWAEVVRRDPRKPGFVGDMPHAWIASDYIRSVLDMFAYQRSRDGALILAAGLPTAWLEGEGAGISGLRTPWGRLDYRLWREADHLRLCLDAEALPPGGFVMKWPYGGTPGEAHINGQAVLWHGGELHIDAAHAEVIIEAPHGAA